MYESLMERINRSNASLPKDEAKVLFLQLAKAIEYMHSVTIVHRDVKSQNVMLATKEKFTHLKLIDFGMSKTDSNLLSFKGAVV